MTQEQIIQVLEKHSAHNTLNGDRLFQDFELDQAAAAIMELVDKELEEFTEFLREGYSNKWHGYVQNHWHKMGDSDHQNYTTTELLTIFSQSKPAKND